MVTVRMLLISLFVSGSLADCSAKLSITAPTEMEALSGSCLRIPCNFTPTDEQEVDSTGNIFGVWIKKYPQFLNHPTNVIFNSSMAVTTYPMRMTGNLTQKNCTTVFSNLTTQHADTYFFRVEKKVFKATASCEPLQIRVKNSPQKPKIEISGDLKEKKSVTITCSAFTPCPHSPPQLTWTLQQDSHNNMEENTDGTFTTKIQETVTLSDSHDGNNISCSATYPVNEGDFKTAETEVTLSVSHAPKDTSASISPSGLVSAGSSVNLTCSSRAKPPVSSFTWFKCSTDGPMKVAEGEIYSFNATDEGVYSCVATNDLGEQTSPEIPLTIEGEPVSSMQRKPVLGGIIGIISLICLIIYIWWLKSMHQTQQQTQSQTGEDLLVQVPAGKTEEEEEESFHYGEIDFSKWRREPSSDSAQDGGPQQDAVYAQLKVNKPANTETAEGPEELYVQVRKT